MTKFSKRLHADYAVLLAEVKAPGRSTQYEAFKTVNTELVALYRDIGKLIVTRQTNAALGAAIAEQLAAGLNRVFLGISGYSLRNIFYIREFYLAYRDLPKVQPMVAQIGWSNNLITLQRCKDPLEREVFIRTTRKFGWSKNVLVREPVWGLRGNGGSRCQGGYAGDEHQEELGFE